MSDIKKLNEFIEKSEGIFTSKQVRESGIHSEYLSEKVRNGEIERVSHGIYVMPDVMDDEMFILQCRKSKVIFSYETALYLHDLTDRDPLFYSVTVPSGYNTKYLLQEGIKVHSVKKELFEMGSCEVKTIYGNYVKTYDIERTICDIVKDKNNQDIGILIDALKRYVKRKDKDTGRLMKYAEQLHVTKQVRMYMEVLL